VLILVFAAGEELFRTGWFVESLVTQLATVLVIRTYRPFYRSLPGKYLSALALAMMIVAVLLPYMPGLSIFDFVPLPPQLLASLLGISILYVSAVELAKWLLYRKASGASQ
jgi:Mg2+-importing ATPase